MDSSEVVKSIGYDQSQMISDIIKLHVPGGVIEVDPTYSKGIMYNGIDKPLYKYDIAPQTEDTVQCDARTLPFNRDTVSSIMFDPPFLVSGRTWDDQEEGNINQKRFGCFYSIDDLWEFYYQCLREFNRILIPEGVLIFKCQDQVSSGKQYFSHVQIINDSIKMGFYPKDLFILLAKNRLTSFGGRWEKQRHARKHHSYFLVLEKRK